MMRNYVKVDILGMEKRILTGISITAAVSGISLAGILFYLTPAMGFAVLFLFYANLFLFLFSCFALCGFAYDVLFLKSDFAWPADKSENYRFAVLRRSFFMAFLFAASLFLQKMKLFGYLSGSVLLLFVIGTEAYFSAKR